jgi:hypothetical protein
MAQDPTAPKGAPAGCEHWHKGPLPPNTYNWGGVVAVGDEGKMGFMFADFGGDKVTLVGTGSGRRSDTVLRPDEVAWYNNSLTLPPRDMDQNASAK